ncbi:MAG TPA: transcription termination factor Rho [Chthoniobacterales bacterium]
MPDTSNFDPLIAAPAPAKRKRAPAKKTSAEVAVATEPAKSAPKRKRAVKAPETTPEIAEPVAKKKTTRSRKPKTPAVAVEESQLVQPELIVEKPPQTVEEPPKAVAEEAKQPEPSVAPDAVAEEPPAQPASQSPYQRQERSHNPNVITVSNYPPYQPGVTKVQTKSHPPREHRERRENREFQPSPDQAPQQPVNPNVQVGPVEPVYAEGLVEVSNKGFGFLREPKRNYAQSPLDIFVTPEVIRRYLLRDGQWIKGEIRRGSRGPQLFKLTEINGEDPEKYTDLTAFEELTTINPDQRIKLETDPERYTTRVIDMITPVGKGQRGLIVAPPRTGKTTLLQHIAEGVIKNHPSMKLIILLVDERPEEVTEIRRTVPQAEIMASSNDSDLKSHTRICQLAIERAKRLVEAEEDVFILLDSITRVARAFNNATAGGGRTGSGGLDTRAMEIPRKLFAAARNTEEGGSLTIIGTALVETGSLMDEVIFQEFKGTGNMELVLDRKIAEQRIYPAIDIFKSGTRREELLLPPNDLEKINTIRRGLAGHRPGEAIERLLSFLKKFPTNGQMLREIPG